MRAMIGSQRQSLRKALVFGGLAFGLVLLLVWWLPAEWCLPVGLLLSAAALGSRPVQHLISRRNEAAQWRREHFKRTADQQNWWASRGDNRGIYGPSGAESMRSISPPPDIERISNPGDEVEPASIAHTADELNTLLTDQPPGWRYAVLASVVVQRRAAVRRRLLDAEFSYCPTRRGPVLYGAQLHAVLHRLLSETVENVGKVDNLMLSKSFTTVFESSQAADPGVAEDIVHIANRLMDYHDRFLSTAEECRDLSVWVKHVDVQRDCMEMLNLPLHGYRRFEEEFVKRIGEMGEIYQWAVGDVVLDRVTMNLGDDPRLLKRVMKELRALSR